MKISDLGLVEMTRKRTRDTIVRSLCESCSNCEGKGFIKSKQTVAYEILREIEREGVERDVSKVLIQAHPDVIDILAIDERETVDQLERRYRKQVFLQAVGDFHAEQFEIVGDKAEHTGTGESTYQIQGRGGRGRNRSSSSSSSSSSGSGGGSSSEKGGDRERGGRDRDRGRAAAGGPPANPRKIQLKPRPLPMPLANSGEVVERQPGNLADGPMNSSGISPEGEIRHTGPANQDGFFDEEDRLAFLRAQATQDAALARLGNAGAGAAIAPSGRGDRPRGGAPGGARGPREEGAGGRRGRRGRRGGKFRGPADDRGPRPAGTAVPRGPIAPLSKPDSASAPVSAGDGGGGSTSGGGSSEGGGGDSSV